VQGVKVAVIGAGLAGLRAASGLSRAGYDVTVVERRSNVGGASMGTWVDDFSFDSNMPLMRSSDRALLSWIDQSDLAGHLLPPREVILSQVYRGGVQPIETGGLASLAKIPGVKAWDKKRLLRLPRLMDRYRAVLDPDRPELAAQLDYRSARDFGTLYLGKSLWDHWVSPETTSEYVGDEMELSRVAFLLSRIASREGRAALGVLRKGLWELAERVASGLEIARDLVADEIDELRGGGYVIRCSPGDGATTRPARRLAQIEVDAVVIATSPEVAGQIAAPVLVPAERDYFAHYRSGPSISMSLAVDAPIGHQSRFVRVPKAEGSSIECYLCEHGTTDGRAPEGKSLVTLRANDRFARANLSAGNDVVEKSLLAALSRYHPTAADQLLFTRLHRRSAGNPNFQVGAYRDLERFTRVQEDRCGVGRRIYFAGDYLVGPGANHAVASGRRAAADLLAHFGS
jgi:oxygen-dependent protoporphyrinogen oxidase